MSEWIRRLDRMPVHGQTVLVNVPQPAGVSPYAIVCEAWFDDGRHMKKPKPRWQARGRVLPLHAVSHWMRMPDPCLPEPLQLT